MDFAGRYGFFAGRYGFVKHSSDVTVYANTKIVEYHRHYRAILIAINFIIYKLCIFFAAFEI